MNLIKKRLTSAATTLVVVFVFSVVCITYSRWDSIMQADARSNDSLIIIAYRNVNLLKLDLSCLNEMEVEFCLPDYRNNSSKYHVSLIIEMENTSETLKAINLLKSYHIPAIIALNESMNEYDIKLMRKSYDKIDFEFALLYDCIAEDCVEFGASLTETRLKYYEIFGESCKNIVINDGSIMIDDIEHLPMKAFTGIHLFGFGNGINRNPSLTQMYNRIVRIPELSIDQYFLEIAK